MKATLTKSSRISSDQRRIPGRSIVYVKSPLDKIADEFAVHMDIYNLPYKSKTWSALCGLVSKITSKLLRDQIFVGANSIKFSAKAGCTCGCSPGYIVKKDDYALGQNHWVDIELTEEELSTFRRQVFSLTRMTSVRKENEAYLKRETSQEALV